MWSDWVAAVLAIGQSKGLAVQVDYPGPGLATFYWRAASGLNGIAGAGESMIWLTTPQQFTALWGVSPPLYQPAPGEIPGPGFEIFRQEWERGRAGRYVPRIPARAVADALEVLFA